MPKRTYRRTRQEALQGIMHHTGFENYRNFDIDLVEMRYEALKRLSNAEFAEIRKRNMRGERIDDVVDDFVVRKLGGKFGIELREELGAEVGRMAARFSVQNLAHRALRYDVLLEFLRTATADEVAGMRARCPEKHGYERKMDEIVDDLYDTLPSLPAYDAELPHEPS